MPSQAQSAKKAGRRQGSARPTGRQAASSRTMLWVIIGAVVLILIGVVVLQTGLLNQAPQAQSANSSGEGQSWGPAGAPVTLVEYSNFGCTHCRNFALNSGRQLRQEYESTGKVRFDFKNFRLSDATATDAANAALCAADQGRFWDYHDLLFARQGLSASPFATAALKQYGSQLNLNAATFNTCVDKSSHLEQVLQESQQGLAQGVEATPTFFINGQKTIGDMPYADLKKLVDDAIQAAQK